MLSMRLVRRSILSCLWLFRRDQERHGRLLRSWIGHTRPHVCQNIKEQSGHFIRFESYFYRLLRKLLKMNLFYWKKTAKGWKTTIRRCASRSDFSVSWGCRYYIDEVGLYVETCYCSDRDGCTSSDRAYKLNRFVSISLSFLAILFAKLF
jgi:hypothetical protein